jgi:TonB-linked SusC/RagA family outer membrane protein
MKAIYKKLLFLLLFLPFSVLAQGTLGGTVVDSKTNQPIPGVNVVIQGSTSGTQTDFDGKFKLPKVNKGDKLVFSFIGYTSQTVTFNNQQSINVSLVEESNELKEVVVQVGYGSVKKKDATGSVVVVASKDFNKGMNATAENLLSGKVAGLTITTGGAPGSGSTIRIRGGASLSASNDPLIVIDGLPIDNNTGGGSVSVLSSINPGDIESFSVLKDASATAIYGSRASNGVIIITTKKGSKGPLQVSFNSTTTFNHLAKKVDVLNADEYRSLVNKVGTTAQKGLIGKSSTDWQNVIFADAISSDSNLSLKGNLLNTIPARLSVGYTQVPGILKTSEFSRTTSSLTLNPSFFDNHLKINLNANISWEDNRFADEGAISSALRFDPTQAVYNSKSIFGGYNEWFQANGDPVGIGAPYNPLSLLELRNNETKNTRTYGNVQVDYKFHFFPDLRAVVNVGLDKQDGHGSNTLANTSRAGFSTGTISGGNFINFGSYSNFTDTKQNKLLDAYFVYAKEIGKLKLDLTGGYSYQYFKRESYNSGNIYDPKQVPDVNTNPDINLQSYFGRLNLNFSSKYFATLNYRRDGTSRFSPENRWGDFFGGSVGWKISEENFLKDNKTISNLKLRLGWGQTGQQDISAAYAYIPRYTTGTQQGQYQFGNEYITFGRPEGYNTTLTWETTTQKEISLEFGLFENRLGGEINFYNKESNDLLANTAIPDGANLTNQGFRNFGSFTSKGVDLSLNYKIIQSENLNWGVLFNTSYNKQEITELVNGIDIPTGDIDGGSNNQVQIHSVGYAPFSFYVYQQIYDGNGRPIEGAYVDRNGDGVISAKDKYRFKKPTADYTFGLSTNMDYKHWDFSMAWRASAGNYMYNNNFSDKGYLQAGIRYPDVISNLNSDYLNTGFVQEGNERYYSDYFVQKASWIKLDNLVLGYTFEKPAKKVSKLRMNVGIQNVLTITDYKGIDPENSGGIDRTIYPRARMFLLGVNLDF